MQLSKKLQKLVEQRLITAEQAQKIMASENTAGVNHVWSLMYWLAGLLIGLGVILIIGSNWDIIPAPVKVISDFVLFGGVLSGLYWSLIHKKDRLKELFLALSFLMVGATIGLVAQIFNLNGGLQSFALSWAFLGLIYVLLSKMMSLNIIWLILALRSFPWERVFEFLADFIQHNIEGFLVLQIIINSLLIYAGNELYKYVQKRIVLPKAFAALFRFYMYFTVLCFGLIANIVGYHSLEVNMFLINIIVLGFLGARLFLASHFHNMKSFVRNCYITELYIIYLFFSFYGNLFVGGLGFIIGGLIILGSLYILKNTKKYIKHLGIFHE